MTFTRYAIYFAPSRQASWADFATRWLGWDAEAGEAVVHPVLGGIDVASVTEAPRKYGLHATLKPPFRLREGQSVEALQTACAQLAASGSPITLQGLAVTRLGRFLALCPQGDTHALNALAAACVVDLDNFRAPVTEAEIARRRGPHMTPEQDTNLIRWGYPYVMDAFRFHITLSGRMDKPTLTHVQSTLESHLDPLLPSPFQINDLALVGEAEDGRFHLIQRYALSG
ncbi:DUF1045 domain-containing protein [Ruegeria sp.]|uniref:DUF1045 domain-containing protein n=1 Tax=Ruegeria sp. TaxID=1879320 RepID=UPI0023213481|nr:DUF1045 domain-containing protein [Ruegeria sp.]MDA7966295.1 DUF1045 domain-containing protein [Ruegeria sp.]